MKPLVISKVLAEYGGNSKAITDDKCVKMYKQMTDTMQVGFPYYCFYGIGSPQIMWEIGADLLSPWAKKFCQDRNSKNNHVKQELVEIMTEPSGQNVQKDNNLTGNYLKSPYFRRYIRCQLFRWTS